MRTTCKSIELAYKFLYSYCHGYFFGFTYIHLHFCHYINKILLTFLMIYLHYYKLVNLGFYFCHICVTDNGLDVTDRYLIFIITLNINITIYIFISETFALILYLCVVSSGVTMISSALISIE